MTFIFSDKSMVGITNEDSYKQDTQVNLNNKILYVKKVQKRNVFWVLSKFHQMFCPNNHLQQSRQEFFDLLESKFGCINDLGYSLFVVYTSPILQSGVASPIYMFYQLEDLPNTHKYQISGIIDDILEYYSEMTDVFDAEKLEGFEMDNLTIRLLVVKNEHGDELTQKLEQLGGDFKFKLKIEEIGEGKAKMCKMDFKSIKKASYDPYYKWKKRLPKILEYLKERNNEAYFSELCKDLKIKDTVLRRYFTYDPLKDLFEIVIVGNKLVIKQKVIE